MTVYLSTEDLLFIAERVLDRVPDVTHQLGEVPAIAAVFQALYKSAQE